MVQLLNNLFVKTEGNWKLHLHAVKEIMPLFSVFDRNNYLRWLCAIYIEDICRIYQKLHQSYTKPFYLVFFMLSVPQVNLTSWCRCVSGTENKLLEQREGQGLL